jgi:hypothetical protein
VIGILGANGFIGSHLVSVFPDAVRITRESSLIRGKIETLFIAAPTSRKYQVNRFPSEDLVDVNNILKLIQSSNRVENIVLVSTIDVYSNLESSSEISECKSELSYGGNRHFLETQLSSLGSNLKICRTGGLFGTGIKKNLMYDLVNRRTEFLMNYNMESTYQWLPVDFFIKELLEFSCSDLSLKNIVGEPISVKAVVQAGGFQIDFGMYGELRSYDVTSNHEFNGYSLGSGEILCEINQYIQGYLN